MKTSVHSSRASLRQRPLAACLAAAFAIASSAAHAHDHAGARPLPDRPASTNTPSVITIFNCTDNGIGSLRISIGLAVSGDTVDLSQLTCSTITLTSGAIAVDVDALTLKGSPTHRVTIDGDRGANHYNHAIKHTGAGVLAINDLTIANAKYKDGDGKGGCIYSSGNVYLTRSTIINCEAFNSVDEPSGLNARGGGVWAHGNVKLTNSVVSGNVALASYGRAVGGGVYAKGKATVMYSTIHKNQTIADVTSFAGGLYAGGDTFIDDSTISSNEAPSGAGVFLPEGPQHADIVNSTISGNIAGEFTAGIEAGCALYLKNSTIAFNSAGYGGGALVIHANSTIGNTIIVGNVEREHGFESDFLKDPGVTLSASKNMIGITASSAFPPGSGTLIGSHYDLNPLSDNGGPTRTHAPVRNSHAIDGGGPTIPVFDQRGPGFKRVRGIAVDIGSIEFDPDIIFVNGFN